MWRFLKKLEIELPYNSAIPLLAYTPRKPELKETHIPQCSSQQSQFTVGLVLHLLSGLVLLHKVTFTYTVDLANFCSKPIIKE